MKSVFFQIGKSLYYLFGKIIAALAILGVTVFAFVSALNTANVLVIAKDAFTMRASMILIPIDNDDEALLDEIFTEEYLQESQLAEQQINGGYRVTNYAQRTDVKFKLVTPWADTVQVEVKDVIEDVRATANDDLLSYGEVDTFIESGNFLVTLVKDKESNKWMVDDIEMVETVQPKSVLPVPTLTPEIEENAPLPTENDESSES